MMRKLMVGLILTLIVAVMSPLVGAAVPVEVKVNAIQRVQGEVLIIQALGTTTAPTGSFLQTPLRFLPYNGGWIAFSGIPSTANPGTYTLQVALENGRIVNQPIQIHAGNFKESRITVSDSQAKIVNPGAGDRAIAERKQKEKQRIEEVYSKSDPQPLWAGPFIQPVQGKVTTEYGYTRYVNGVPNDRHTGLDIANAPGTPVMAANDGIVRLADQLLETGYTIIIDHGAGVYSSYSHLSKLQVREGDLVYRGQTIGRMGSTGVSTGSHLHWVMRTGQDYLNPRTFVGTNLFQDVHITLY